MPEPNSASQTATTPPFYERWWAGFNETFRGKCQDVTHSLGSATPIVGAGLVAGAGILVMDPLTSLGRGILRVVRNVITGFGYLERIPLIGDVFTLAGQGIDMIGEFSGAIITGIASLVTYKVLEPDPIPAGKGHGTGTVIGGEGTNPGAIGTQGGSGKGPPLAVKTNASKATGKDKGSELTGAPKGVSNAQETTGGTGKLTGTSPAKAIDKDKGSASAEASKAVSNPQRTGGMGKLMAALPARAMDKGKEIELPASSKGVINPQETAGDIAIDKGKGSGSAEASKAVSSPQGTGGTTKLSATLDIINNKTAATREEREERIQAYMLMSDYAKSKPSQFDDFAISQGKPGYLSSQHMWYDAKTIQDCTGTLAIEVIGREPFCRMMGQKMHFEPSKVDDPVYRIKGTSELRDLANIRNILQTHRDRIKDVEVILYAESPSCRQGASKYLIEMLDKELPKEHNRYYLPPKPWLTNTPVYEHCDVIVGAHSEAKNQGVLGIKENSPYLTIAEAKALDEGPKPTATPQVNSKGFNGTIPGTSKVSPHDIGTRK